MSIIPKTAKGITFFLSGLMRSIIPMIKRGLEIINPNGFKKKTYPMIRKVVIKTLPHPSPFLLIVAPLSIDSRLDFFHLIRFETVR